MGKKIKRNHERSLPREILSKILIELPAKSVMRFSCVSKTWLSIIKDPYFVESHHVSSYTRPCKINIIVCCRLSDDDSEEDTSTYNVFYTDSEGKSPLVRLALPDVLHSSFHLTRLRSVHGLICAGNCIWNPTTNESIVLPSISLTTSIDGEYFGYNYNPEYYLGFDSTNNAYKVLCILQINHSKYLDFGVKIRDSTSVFKILDLGGSSWRDVESVPSEIVDSYHNDPSCSIDNLICFNKSKSILAFDFRCEKFVKIPLPDGLASPCHMVKVRECISLINVEIETMWILEDYKKRRWRSERIEIGPLLEGMKSKVKSDEYKRITPLGANHNGEILLEIWSGGRQYYYYYDIDTKTGRKIFKLTRRMNEMHQNLSIHNVSLKTHVESIYRLK